MNVGKIILTGLSPNITRRDALIALTYLFLPVRWRQWKCGPYPEVLEEALKTYFSLPYAITIDSGRSALLLALKTLGIHGGDSVIVQAYTCIVVINAIRAVGAHPVYVDIQEDFCLDPDDLERKITPQTKAMIVQHTFGKAADMFRITEIAKKYHLPMIEDCAHAIGTTFDGKKVGTFGDLAVLSFGSDKVCSSARGGAILTKDETLAKCLRQKRDELSTMDTGWLLQHLLHFPVFYLGRLWYSIWIGKMLLALAKKLHIINRIIEPAEKRGEQPPFFPTRYPNALAKIALAQFNEVDALNGHRRDIAAVYDTELKYIKEVTLPKQDAGHIYLRYTICLEGASHMREMMKRKGILLGDWYSTVIAPEDCEGNVTEYSPGFCANAERLAQLSLNLPTDRHISTADTRYLCKQLRACLNLP